MIKENKNEIIKALRYEVENKNVKIMEIISNILEKFSDIVNKHKCEKEDALYLKENLTKIGFNYNENLTIENNVNKIIDDSKFISKNINKLYEKEKRVDYHNIC